VGLRPCEPLTAPARRSLRALPSPVSATRPTSSSSRSAGTCASGLSYRDVQELLADAARPCRHAVGDRWQVDETDVKVAGLWRYVYRAVDQFGQAIDVFVSTRRDTAAAHRFFERAIGTTKVVPIDVVTELAPVYPAVLEELLPAAWHHTEQDANNRVECDHGRLKARLRPMVHAFFHARIPAQLLATAGPHSSLWLPEDYIQNFRQAA
jgi:DDE domain